MIPALASLAIIATAGWMLTADPAHRFHHEPHVQSVHALPNLPVKSGTTDAKAWRRAMNEAAVIVGGKS